MQSDSLRDQDLFESDGERRARARERTWQTLGTLYRWRRFIAGVTAAVAVAAVVITLLMPNWYAASARLLPPESRGGGVLSSALLNNLPSAAASLLGGASGDYARYLTILTSRGMYESAVDTFDLVRVYGTAESAHPREDAIKILQENVGFPINEEYEFLSVVVLDTDPARAAEMANYLVRRLNDRHAELSAQHAAKYRESIGRRYNETLSDLDSLKTRIQRFQEEYGVFNLESQTEAFFQQIAQLRAAALELEIQYETALSQYGPDNPQVEYQRHAVEAARRKYRDAMAGEEAVLPVARQDMPVLFRDYVDLEQQRIMLQRILEVVAPFYEQARFDEEREVQAVQVVDYAVPPVEKAKPRRSIICIAATISAFLLASLFALLSAWWRTHHEQFARHLRYAVDDESEAMRSSHKTPAG